MIVATVGPVREMGRGPRRRRRSPRAPTTSTPPASRPSSARCSSATARAPRRPGSGMLTAFGYDWVPGNLAGALALRDAGEAATRVDTGYFMTGRRARRDERRHAGLAGGRDHRPELRAGATAPCAPSAARPATARSGCASKDRPGVSVGRLRALRAARGSTPGCGRSTPTSAGSARPRARCRRLAGRLGWPSRCRARRASAAPPPTASSRARPAARTPSERARSGSHIVGEAYDAGRRRARRGPPHRRRRLHFTGEILAWGAERAAAGGLKGVGALGPVDGFGLDELEAGCAEAGLSRASAELGGDFAYASRPPRPNRSASARRLAASRRPRPRRQPASA